MQDSKLTRAVDLYVGTFSCRVISLLRSGRFFRKESKDVPQKILMIELFEMGAAVMLSPSIQYLKKQNPNVEIHALTTKSCAPIWKALDAIEEKNIHCIESKSPLGFIISAIKMTLHLWRQRFDLIVDYELFMRIPALFSGVLRSKRRAGFYKYDFEGLNRGNFYDSICAYNQNSHISKNYLALTRTAFERREDSPNFKASLLPSEIEIKPVFKSQKPNSLGPYFVICADVGKTLAVRNYPRESFAKIIDGLLMAYPQHKIVFIGTEENKATSEAIISLVSQRQRCLDYCGKTDFTGLLDVIFHAEFLLTNDNGPGHFATLTGTKTLALFSTDSPFVYGPLGEALVAYTWYQCSPCISAYNHKRSRCDNNLCLQTLAPDKVLALAKKVIDGEAKFRTINNEVSYI